MPAEVAEEVYRVLKQYNERQSPSEAMRRAFTPRVKAAAQLAARQGGVLPIYSDGASPEGEASSNGFSMAGRIAWFRRRGRRNPWVAI